MSFAATAEAIFGPVRSDGQKLQLRKLTAKVKRWAQKLLQEAEKLPDAVEKVTVAYIRAKLITELKNFMDLTEENCIPHYLIKIEKWESKTKTIFRQEVMQPSHKTMTG